MQARIRREITVYAKDEVGVLSLLFGIAEKAGVNIRAFHAYILDGRGILAFVVDSCAAAVAAFEAAGYTCECSEVVLVTAKDRVGAGAEISRRCAEAGVNILGSYGSGAVALGEFQAVLRTTDCERAVQAINA